jgi:hypothetical protein
MQRQGEDPISFIIPYMHTDERYPLLLACLRSLPKSSEICIVELGETKKLNFPPYYKHMFVKYSGIMHRALALNIGVKYLSTRDTLVLLDADVIVPPNFKEVAMKCKDPMVGWNRMFYLTRKHTNNFLEDFISKKLKIFNDYTDSSKCSVVKTPRLDGPAGGVTIVPRKIFFEVKGVPEDFGETWGGPDNTFMAKLQAFGHPFRTVECDTIHLYHSKNTPRVKEIAKKARVMMRWNREKWFNYMDGKEWGVAMKYEINTKPVKMNQDSDNFLDIRYLVHTVQGKKKDVSYSPDIVMDEIDRLWDEFNPDAFKKVIESDETLVSLAMLSLIRTDKLIGMLQHWKRHRYIKSNIALRVQGAEQVSNPDKEKISKLVEDNFEKKHLIYTSYNRGTGVPRHQMIHKALSFNTKYIMTTDDDMFFPPGSVELLISILEDNPKLGAVDMWVYPNLNAWEAKPGRMHHRQPRHGLDYVDAMGSATMVVRREVFETCDYDKNYYIGWGDIDFCMQMRSKGWKLAILALPGYKAFNHKMKNPREYNESRYNAQIAGQSSELFFKKWNRRI